MNDWQNNQAQLLQERYDLLKFILPNYEEGHIILRSSLRDFLNNPNLKKRKPKILDLGCGAGETTLQILGSNDNAQVLAIDGSTDFLEQAKINLFSYQQRIAFLESDVLKALKTIQANSIDAVVSGYLLHNLENKYRDEIFKECHRILKEGGRLFNLDIVGMRNNSEILKTNLKRLKVFKQLGRPDLRLAWKQHYLNDEKTKLQAKTQITHLTRVGFKTADYIWQKDSDSLCIATKGKLSIFYAMPFGKKTYSQIIAERKAVHILCDKYKVKCIEQFIGVESKDGYAKRNFKPGWVMDKDKHYINLADVVMADFSLPSIGRDMEIIIAKELLHKPIISIVNTKDISTHFWIRHYSDYIVKDLETALKLITKHRP